MMKPVICLIVFSVLATVQAVPGTVCTDDSQCGGDECCEIWNEYLIASKRQVTPGPTQKTGTCQKYWTQGDRCDPFTVYNGGCGCKPGLECHFEPEPTPTYPPPPPTYRPVPVATFAPPASPPPGRKRSMMPGTYTCEPQGTK